MLRFIISAGDPKKIEFSTLWKETRVILQRMKPEELLVYRHWSLLYNQPIQCLDQHDQLRKKHEKDRRYIFLMSNESLSQEEFDGEELLKQLKKAFKAYVICRISQFSPQQTKP